MYSVLFFFCFSPFDIPHFYCSCSIQEHVFCNIIENNKKKPLCSNYFIEVKCAKCEKTNTLNVAFVLDKQTASARPQARNANLRLY